MIETLPLSERFEIPKNLHVFFFLIKFFLLVFVFNAIFNANSSYYNNVTLNSVLMCIMCFLYYFVSLRLWYYYNFSLNSIIYLDIYRFTNAMNTFNINVLNTFTNVINLFTIIISKFNNKITTSIYINKKIIDVN